MKVLTISVIYIYKKKTWKKKLKQRRKKNKYQNCIFPQYLVSVKVLPCRKNTWRNIEEYRFSLDNLYFLLILPVDTYQFTHILYYWYKWDPTNSCQGSLFTSALISNFSYMILSVKKYVTMLLHWEK